MASMEVQLPTGEASYHNRYDLRRHNRGPPPQQSPIQQNGSYGNALTAPKSRKRKAGPQENERLSKRLSLLNLEKNGHKLYVPVEGSTSQSIPEDPGYSNNSNHTTTQPPPSTPTTAVVDTDERMQLDDTKHKVYIYDLDAELSSADETSDYDSQPGSPTSGNGRLVFLPDIEKHLNRTRSQIPPAVFANSEGELAGHNINDMQMVLYRVPSSLTVPREHDSVRKAILEARARARQKQINEEDVPISSQMVDSDDSGFAHHNNNNNNNTNQPMNGFGAGFTPANLHQNATPWREALEVDEEYNDVDAMDMD